MDIKMTRDMLSKNKFFTNPGAYNKKDAEEDSEPWGLVLHSVGVPNPDAKSIVVGLNTVDRKAGVHAVLESGIVLQCLPWSYKAEHTGWEINKLYLGIEMTEPNTIRYKNADNWVYDISKVERDGGKITADGIKKIANQTSDFLVRTYDTAVVLFAVLCRLYNLNPTEELALPGHAKLKSYVVTSHIDALMLAKNCCEGSLVKCRENYEGKKSEYCTRNVAKCAKGNAKGTFSQLNEFCGSELIRCNGGHEYCDERLFTCTNSDANQESKFCELARRNCGVPNFDWTYCEDRKAPCGKTDNGKTAKRDSAIRWCEHRVAMCGEDPKKCSHIRTACGKSPETNPLAIPNVCGERIRCDRSYDTCTFNRKTTEGKSQGIRCTSSAHGDPLHLWKRHNLNPDRTKRLTMDGFRHDIAEAMKSIVLYHVVEVPSRLELSVMLGKKPGKNDGYLAGYTNVQEAQTAAETAIAEAQEKSGKKYVVCYYLGDHILQYDPSNQELTNQNTVTGDGSAHDIWDGGMIYQHPFYYLPDFPDPFIYIRSVGAKPSIIQR